MNQLIARSPYIVRDDMQFLAEMNVLTAHHLKSCPAYSKIWGNYKESSHIQDLPYIHVGLFKHLELKTDYQDAHFRWLSHSSSTSGVASKIHLDEKSGQLQAESVYKILADFVGVEKRPLLIIDSIKSLRGRGELSARVAAAMSLKPLASNIYFLLDNPTDCKSIKWDLFLDILKNNNYFIVYGFSWILWLAWDLNHFPGEIIKIIKNKTFCFVHSGGWKRLDTIKVSSEKFNNRLLCNVDSHSKVVDFYGLVEQMGIVYPLCEFNARHIPVWADVIVRNVYTMDPIQEGVGQLQLMNTITYGAPNHNVLTEDIGRILNGDCPCGRKGKRFELFGRVPKAETRGCANV